MCSIAPASGGLCSTGQQGGSAGSDCTGYNFYNQTSWVLLFGGLGHVLKWRARFYQTIGDDIGGKRWKHMCINMKHDVLPVVPHKARLVVVNQGWQSESTDGLKGA